MTDPISYEDENGHEVRLQVLDMKTGVYRSVTAHDLRAAGWVPKDQALIVEGSSEPGAPERSVTAMI